MYGIILFMLYYCVTVLFIALSENKIMNFISLLYLSDIFLLESWLLHFWLSFDAD